MLWRLHWAAAESGVLVCVVHHIRRCRGCHSNVTDVTLIGLQKAPISLADLELSLWRIQHAYDKVVLLTADSNMIPAIQEAKRVHGEGRIINAVPIGRRARALANYVDQQISMKVKHLEASKLPDSLSVGSGRELNCPSEWK